MSTWMDYRGIRVPSATPSNEAGRVLKSDLMILAERSVSPDWGDEAPSDFVATPVGGSIIHLTWEDNALFPAQFVIERSTVGFDGPWSIIHTTAAGATSYYNTGLTPETTYYYRLRGKFGPFYWSALTAEATTTNTVVLPFTFDQWVDGVPGSVSSIWTLRFPKSYSAVSAVLTLASNVTTVACDVNSAELYTALLPLTAGGHPYDGGYPPVVIDAGSEWEWRILWDSNWTPTDPGHTASDFS
jgi:hypothetical protein